MSIFDLFDEPTTYRFVVLEYAPVGPDAPPWRVSAWGPLDCPTIEGAQDCIRLHHPGLIFAPPPEPLLAGGNLGMVAYKRRWNAAYIYRADTDEVVSVGWITPPTG